MNEQLTKIADGWMQKPSPTFSDLSEFIIQTHQSAQNTAIRAINQMATLRNWLIGCYIVEYEQKGSDRAKYGERLLKRLEERVNTKGLNLTLFKNSRRFYLLYPQIGKLFGISPTLSDFLQTAKEYQGISPTVSDFSGENTISATLLHEFKTSPQNLLERLSFSHITEIMTQDDSMDSRCKSIQWT